MKTRLQQFLAVIALAVTTSPALATSHTTQPSASNPVGSAEDADMTNAEVRKVDKESKKLTLKHAAIKSLDMPGMTMVFQVGDAAFLDKIQAGDKVKFKAKKEGNAFVITEIVRAN